MLFETPATAEQPCFPQTPERLFCAAGVPTEEHTIFENLDLMVHPLRVHFNDVLLTNLWVRARIALSDLVPYTHMAEPCRNRS